MDAPATEHVHVVDKRNRTLRCGWCVCGATWSDKRQRWGAPRYFDGTLRRIAWNEKQRLAAAAGDTTRC